MKYIHVDCLKEWLNNKKKVIESEYTITYAFASMSCELCKSPLPDRIIQKNKFFDIVDYVIP